MSSCSRSGRAGPGQRQRQRQGQVGQHGWSRMLPACTVPVMWFWEPPAFQTTAIWPHALGQHRHFSCPRRHAEPCQELLSASSAPSSEHHHPVGCDFLPLQDCCRWWGDRGTYAHHLQPSEARRSHRGAASGDTGLWKGQCLWMLAARHMLSLCHRLVPGPAAAQGLSAPKPKLPALCTHARAHGVNSITSSLYEPGSPQLSCTGRESRGKAPSLPPEPR